MIDSADTLDRGDACGACRAPLGGRRTLLADGARLVSLCSETCLRAAQVAVSKRRWRARRRAMKVFTICLAVAGACLVPHQGPQGQRSAAIVPAPAPRSTAPAAPPAGWFGPEWPPTDTSLLAALGRDAWIHPLAGPVRRMPRSDARVFGAVRPGNRAVECRNGHCGVDLGGEIWGEHVRAVHDGVVDYVQRGPNPDRGGSFVRIGHRDGTVFTWYFHLAAIPRGIERGVFVKSGDVVGLVGDTGVKQSAPHLHFAVSVRLSPGRAERYIDPEPLIALWPLRVPIDGGNSALVTTVAEPGVPLGSATLLAGRKRRLAAAAAHRKGGAAPASGDEEAAAAAGDDGGGEAAAPDEPGDE